MQAIFHSPFYAHLMADKSKLRQLREAAGISVRELARQIGESHTNVSYWERTGQIPRSNKLAPLAKALSISVEELLGEGKTKRTAAPAGKLRNAFEEASRLPRRQQEKLIDFIKLFIAQNSNEQGKPA